MTTKVASNSNTPATRGMEGDGVREIEMLKKQILLLDKTSDEFSELFHVINERYFEFDNPDRYQSAATILNAILHREHGKEWVVEILAQIANLLFAIDNKKTDAGSATAVLDNGKTVTIDCYLESKGKAAIHKMFANTVLKQGGAE